MTTSSVKPSKAVWTYDITITNNGIILAFFLYQLIYTVNLLKGREGRSIFAALFHTTIKMIYLNFGLLFISISTSLLPIARKLVLDPISRLIRPRRRFPYVLGWRSIRLESPARLHIFFSVMFIFWSLVHTIDALCLYYFVKSAPAAMHKRHDGHDHGTPAISTDSATPAPAPDPSAASGHSVDSSTYMLVTGLIAMGLSLIVMATALPPIRKRFFELFYYTHHLFIAITVASILHSGFPRFWIAGVALYIANKIINYISIKKYNSRDVSTDIISEKAIKISFPKKKQLASIISSQETVGKYVCVCFPKISPFQWHSFDLTDGNSENSDSIIIGVKGNWTRKIYNLFAEESKAGSDSGSSFTILTTKKFHSAHAYVFENDVAILVSGGTGISPMIPIMNKFVSDFTAGTASYNLKNIHLVWVCRDKSLFSLLLEPLESFIAKGLADKLSVTVYYTGLEFNESDIDQESKPAFEDYPQISVINGRPDVYDVYTEIITKYEADTSIGIVSAGGKNLTEQVKRFSRKWGRENKRAFRISYYKANW